MESKEEKYPRIKLLGYDVEFHASRFNGIGFALLVGEGVYCESIRFELTLPFFTCGFHVISKKNPPPK